MNEREHVIVLDVCCTIKRPTTMCLARKKKKKKRNFFLMRTSGLMGPLKKADRLTIIRIQSKNKEARVTETSPLKRRVLQQVR